MRRTLSVGIVAITLTLLLVGANVVRASITDCTATVVSCTYLPLMAKPLPSPTPIPPTATSVPPTNTPIPPTATPQPTGVQILGNHTAYVDSINYLHIVGEVANYTSSSLRFVKIVANVYGGGGQFIGTDFTYIYLDSLPPNTRTCFHVLMNQPTGWTSYQFEAPTYSTGGSALPNIALINASGHYNPTYHWYEIIGQARNDQGRRVEYVQPVATLYTGTGQVVGCDFTFVSSTHLDPGQTSSFSFTVSGRNYSDVASYRLQVDGNIQ